MGKGNDWEKNPLAKNWSKRININKTIPKYTKIKFQGNEDKEIIKAYREKIKIF